MKSLIAQMHSFDEVVDRFVERHLRGRAAFDRLFYAASFAGDHSGIWVILALLRGVLQSDWYVPLRVLIAIPIESLIVNGIIKSFFRRTRPVHDGHRPHRLRTPKTSSFPSGHATSAFTAATLLSWQMEYGWVIYVLAAIVAFSRIYVKIHHASDVIVGMALGLLLGFGFQNLLFG